MPETNSNNTFMLIDSLDRKLDDILINIKLIIQQLDSTNNVIDLVESNSKRIDDLFDAEKKRVDSVYSAEKDRIDNLILAEKNRVDELLEIIQNHYTELSERFTTTTNKQSDHIYTLEKLQNEKMGSNIGSREVYGWVAATITAIIAIVEFFTNHH